jgi:uncharacterized protein
MLAAKLEDFLFGRRQLVLLLLGLATLFFAVQASRVRIDAGFEKQLPLEHPYMATFMEHQVSFGGANRVLVAVAPRSGDIFTAPFMATLKAATDDVFFIPGVDRARVSSLVTPDVRFIEVNEEGFAGGNVVPADFAGTPEQLAIVRENTLKSGQVGRLVATDFSAALISAQLLDRDPATGARLDYLAVAEKLEELRAKYPDVTIHIIGFAQMVGDIATGAKGVAVFFAIAFCITGLLLLWYTRSQQFTAVLLGGALTAVVWQVGLMVSLGYGIDPMSILLPFLVFAIAVSHGVQMVGAINHALAEGASSSLAAARLGFARVLGPGSTALITDVAGFLTLLLIAIPMIRELAIAASVGVAVILVTNLVLLPLLLSFIRHDPAAAARQSVLEVSREPIWAKLSGLTQPRAARLVVVIAILIGGLSWWAGQGMVIGDAAAGVPEFRQNSRYNQDAAYITARFNVGTDILTVIAKSSANACVEADVISYLDRFDWHLRSLPEVQSTLSLPQVMTIVASGWNEGNLKWRTLPSARGDTPEEQARIRSLLTQASRSIETSTGLLNADCSIMPIMIFLKDHKAASIDSLAQAIVVWQVANPFAARDGFDVKLQIGTGNISVMAATNDAVRAAQWPMLLAVYAAVGLFCLIIFRSVKAMLFCLLPLVLVGFLANALMAVLGIGLKVATLPVASLGVGIGVDYAIYIYSRLQVHMAAGLELKEAWLGSLRETGSAVLFTGLTLAAGVSTWIFSALKFQADMGLLLTFMFIANMLGALVLLPALVALFTRSSARSRGH